MGKPKRKKGESKRQARTRRATEAATATAQRPSLGAHSMDHNNEPEAIPGIPAQQPALADGEPLENTEETAGEELIDTETQQIAEPTSEAGSTEPGNEPPISEPETL